MTRIDPSKRPNINRAIKLLNKIRDNYYLEIYEKNTNDFIFNIIK